MGSDANQFLGAFTRFRDRPCLIDGASGRSLSYAEVFSLVCAYRDHLKQEGAGAGDMIVFVPGNRMELAISYFAVSLGGMRAVPIDPLKGETEIASILDQIESRLLVTDDVARFASSSAPVLDIAAFPQEASEINPVTFSLDLEVPFLVTFTSGTTGKPKGVMHSLGNFIRTATAFSSRFGFGPDNIFYHNLPMTYMAGILNQIFQPIIAGATLVIGPRFAVSNVASFWSVPAKYGVNTFWFNPSMLALLLKLDRGNDGVEFAHGRNIIGCVGTAPLPSRVKEEFQKKYGIKLYESYGLSETLFVATEDPQAVKDGSVGRPLDGIEVSFAEDGELLVKADWMFKGYIGRADGLENGYFPSGDLGKLEDGRLFVTGRKKDLIIRGGINLSPRAIELIVAERPDFEEIAIVGMPDETLGEKTVCFYVKSAAFRETAGPEANSDVVAKLGSAYRIDQFIEVDALPRNMNGKIDTNRLKKLMIIALDHVAIAVPDFEAAIKSWQESGYTARFVATEIPNPSIKKPFMQEWSDGHDLALLTREGYPPVELIGYGHGPQGESALNLVPKSSRLFQHTSNPEEAVAFWKRFGFQSSMTNEGRILLRWQTALSKSGCEIELRPVVETVESFLDSEGINSVAFLSSNARQERERLIKEGCRVTDVESLEVNEKKLDIFFAIGARGELCEIISPST